MTESAYSSEPQADFLRRALLSRNQAKETGQYYSVDEVLFELTEMLSHAETKDNGPPSE